MALILGQSLLLLERYAFVNTKGAIVASLISRERYRVSKKENEHFYQVKENIPLDNLIFQEFRVR